MLLAQAATPTVIPTDAGVAIASGTLDVSTTEGTGGSIDVLGDRVALVTASLEASGAASGGSVRVGGGYQGDESVQNAQQTYVGHDATIEASAMTAGDGGRVIVWADGDTVFNGEIFAEGGTTSGNGGFVEVSGQQNLAFDGNVVVNAANGSVGTLLLDPTDIVISNTNSSEGVDSSLPQILQENFADQPITISIDTLRSQTGNIQLEATNDISSGCLNRSIWGSERFSCG
ncbi:MAG: hypothetical protein AAFV46_10080 [Cyanobacteria bacterium J06635_11]